jgi:Pectate lyase superfamily protein
MVHKLGWLLEDYGGVGDGSTDNASAFSALITGMKTRTTAHGQQHVALRPKVYRTNSPIVLDASGLQLHGHNVVGSVIEAGPSFPAGSPLISVIANSGNTQLTDIEIGGLTLRRVNADGPLIRFSGCKACAVTNCILAACNTYISITKPGSAANLHIVLTGLDCTGAPATGIQAASVDALRVADCKIKCAGASANGIDITTGDHCSARNVLFENCGNAPIKLRTNVTNFLFLGGGRVGSITRWIDDDTSCSGNSVGRRWTTNPPTGTWDLFGPLDN